MINKILTSTLIVFGLFSSNVIAAESYPTMGLLYNTKEDSSLTYDCTKKSETQMTCDFIQVAVRKESKPEKLGDVITKAKAGYAEAVKELENGKDKDSYYLKSMFEAMIGVYNGQKTPEIAYEELPKEIYGEKGKTAKSKQAFIESMNNIKEGEKQDRLREIEAALKFVNDKDEASYIAVEKIKHQKATRSCRVISFPFTQTFKRIAGNKNNPDGTWVNDSPPSGECGVVQLNRFEKSYSSSGDFSFWVYISRKAVTNPKGEGGALLKCTDFDEAEYLYDWEQKRPEYFGCDYIKFSVF